MHHNELMYFYNAHLFQREQPEFFARELKPTFQDYSGFENSSSTHHQEFVATWIRIDSLFLWQLNEKAWVFTKRIRYWAEASPRSDNVTLE